MRPPSSPWPSPSTGGRRARPSRERTRAPRAACRRRPSLPTAARLPPRRWPAARTRARPSSRRRWPQAPRSRVPAPPRRATRPAPRGSRASPPPAPRRAPPARTRQTGWPSLRARAVRPLPARCARRSAQCPRPSPARGRPTRGPGRRRRPEPARRARRRHDDGRNRSDDGGRSRDREPRPATRSFNCASTESSVASSTGLVTKRARAVLARPLAVLRRVVAGAHDHRNRGRLGVGRDDARDLVAVHVGHHEVHEDHVRRVALQEIERLVAGTGRVHAQAAGFEHALQLELHHLGIVDDQRFADVHRAPLLPQTEIQPYHALRSGRKRRAGTDQWAAWCPPRTETGRSGSATGKDRWTDQAAQHPAMLRCRIPRSAAPTPPRRRNPSSRGRRRRRHIETRRRRTRPPRASRGSRRPCARAGNSVRAA